MNEIIKKNKILPYNIKDLTKFVLVGREKLVSVRAEIRAINKIDIATNVREQKNEEAQMLAGALLDAEVKIGDLLKKIERKPIADSSSTRTFGGSKKTLPEGINKKQSHYFQSMADNKDIVKQVKNEAKKNDDLPTRTEVLRLVKRKQQEKVFEKIIENNDKLINGKYDVIIIDPSWQIEKIDRNITPEQTGFDYPTMTIDEIKKIELPHKENCHVFMWTTQKYLKESFDIFDYWEINYILTMVWHKNGGFQPFNLPQYNCEFILYGRIGTPKFKETKNFFTCFSAKRTGHSKKPDEFYELIKRVTVGKRIDMFNRRKIDGFDVWGNQS